MACYLEIQARNGNRDISNCLTLRLYIAIMAFIQILHSKRVYHCIIVTSVLRKLSVKKIELHI